MRGRASNGFQVLRSAIRLLLPAWLLYAIAALLVHPVSLVALLFANAIVMTAISRAIGFDHDTRFVQGLARRGVAYFIATSAYAALVAGLVAMPAWWLMRRSRKSQSRPHYRSRKPEPGECGVEQFTIMTSGSTTMSSGLMPCASTSE